MANSKKSNGAKKSVSAKSNGKSKKAVVKTEFREGTAKAKAFAAFKSAQKSYQALPHGGKKEWQGKLAKQLKLSPATVASWAGGQFAQALRQ